MATIPLLVDGIPAAQSKYNGDAVVSSWPAMAAGDVGEATTYSTHGDRTAQISGTFGGTTVTIEGSLDGVSWFTLTDPTNASISVTAAALLGVTEATKYIRPRCTGGTGVAVTVSVFSRR